MNVLPQTGVRATSIFTFSSFVGAMPPATCKVASKEDLESSTEEAVEVTNPTIPIYADTQCFIDKSTEVTWSGIKDTFMQKRFLENLEELEFYINIKLSRMHKITCRFPIIPCAEVIECIITHMDDSDLMLHSERGGKITMYYGEDMKIYYKMLRSTKYAYNDFYTRWVNLEISEIIKYLCWDPANICHYPSVVYLTNILRYVYKYLISMCYWLHGWNNAEVFEENWIYMLNMVVTYGKYFNWEDILSF